MWRCIEPSPESHWSVPIYSMSGECETGDSRKISYVFFDRSHTSTASSLTQQNIVADFGDQQISKTGFWRENVIHASDDFDRHESADLSRCECQARLKTIGWPKRNRPISRWWQEDTFGHRTPGDTIHGSLSIRENIRGFSIDHRSCWGPYTVTGVRVEILFIVRYGTSMNQSFFGTTQITVKELNAGVASNDPSTYIVLSSGQTSKQRPPDVRKSKLSALDAFPSFPCSRFWMVCLLRIRFNFM